MDPTRRFDNLSGTGAAAGLEHLELSHAERY